MGSVTIGQQESLSITSYRRDYEYKLEAHVPKEYKLEPLHREILKQLNTYPYLTRAVLEICLMEKLEKVLSELFINGIVERFRVTRKNGRQVSVFYSLGKGIFAAHKDFLGQTYFPYSYLRELDTQGRLELATLSQWCALTQNHYGRKSVHILGYGKPTRKVPYVEACVRKNVCIKETKLKGKRGYLDYMFHVMPRPKAGDMEELYLENILCKAQNSLSECEGRCFVLVLCESERDMEELACVLYMRAKERTSFEMFYQKILYSLEMDAFDEKGSFKYCNVYSIEENVLKRMQVAFK